jgi:hypothetical protein
MALISCGYCTEKWEAALDDQWLCGCGGGAWGIGIVDYSPSEIQSAFAYLASLRQSGPVQLRDAILPVAAAFEGTVNRFVEGDKENSPRKFRAFLDTLLLFFPSVAFRDVYPPSLIESLGEEKYEAYHSAGAIRTVSTWTQDLFAKELGRSNLPPMDFNVYDTVYDPSVIGSHMRLHCYLDNIAAIYSKEFVRTLFDFGVVQRDKPNQLLIEVGEHKYFIGALDEFFPNRIFRGELTAYVLGGSLLTDGYYSLGQRFRSEQYARVAMQSGRDPSLFYRWISGQSIRGGSLPSDAVLEFRDRHGTFARFIADVRIAAQRELSPGEIRDLADSFALELEKRITDARKVLSRAHDAKAVYLTGLFSTLGGLIGGMPGAFVGGVGGRAITQLALEYDRQIPGPLAFLVENVKPKRSAS